MRRLPWLAACNCRSFLGYVPAHAAECPGNPEALGREAAPSWSIRTEHPRLGTMQYRETLPLNDHEVVLTFDDGPLPPQHRQDSRYPGV